MTNYEKYKDTICNMVAGSYNHEGFPCHTVCKLRGSKCLIAEVSSFSTLKVCQLCQKHNLEWLSEETTSVDWNILSAGAKLRATDAYTEKDFIFTFVHYNSDSVWLRRDSIWGEIDTVFRVEEFEELYKNIDVLYDGEVY